MSQHTCAPLDWWRSVTVTLVPGIAHPNTLPRRLRHSIMLSVNKPWRNGRWFGGRASIMLAVLLLVRAARSHYR